MCKPLSDYSKSELIVELDRRTGVKRYTFPTAEPEEFCIPLMNGPATILVIEHD